MKATNFKYYNLIVEWLSEEHGIDIAIEDLSTAEITTEGSLISILYDNGVVDVITIEDNKVKQIS